MKPACADGKTFRVRGKEEAAAVDWAEDDGEGMAAAAAAFAERCLLCREVLDTQKRAMALFVCGHSNVHLRCASKRSKPQERCPMCVASALTSPAFEAWRSELVARWERRFASRERVSGEEEKALSLFVLMEREGITPMQYILDQDLALPNLYEWTAEQLALAKIDVGALVAMQLQKTQMPLFERLELRDWVRLGLTLESARVLGITHLDFRHARFLGATLPEFCAAVAPDAPPAALLRYNLSPSPPARKKGGDVKKKK